METSHHQQQQQQQQPLSIESFSYSWLANLKPSLEALLDDVASSAADASSSFIEMDPRMPPSKRFFHHHSHDFKFDSPLSIALVHADELFADGYVVPFFLRKPNHSNHHDDDSEEEEEESSNSVTSSSPASAGSRTDRDRPVRRSGRKTSSLRRVLEKYLELIGPLLGKLAGRRGGGPRNQRSLSSRSEGMVMDNHNHKSNNKKRVISNKLAMRRWLSSGAASSRVSAAGSEEDGWRRSAASSCDSETSIQEAVLHCKRSFGK